MLQGIGGVSRLRFRDRNRQETLGGEAVLGVSWQQFRSHHEGAKGFAEVLQLQEKAGKH